MFSQLRIKIIFSQLRISKTVFFSQDYFLDMDYGISINYYFIKKLGTNLHIYAHFTSYPCMDAHTLCPWITFCGPYIDVDPGGPKPPTSVVSSSIAS
jgi:hypothetical protein